jgi:hypothetical protein
MYHVIYDEMDRVPLFIFDRYNGSNELVFLKKTSLCKSHLVFQDLEDDSGNQCLLTVPRTTPAFPHLLIVHEDGKNGKMIAIDDVFWTKLKMYKLNKELIDKHMERQERPRRSNRLRAMKKSRLSVCNANV